MQIFRLDVRAAFALAIAPFALAAAVWIAAAAPDKATLTDPHLIGQYVGRYRDAQWEITTTREGNQLFAEATGFGRYTVYPFTDHDFFATILPAQISFVTDG